MSKNTIIFIGAALGWFSTIMQFVLMMQNRVESLTETTLRFFSYFTILTTSLVALYFSVLWYRKPISFLARFEKPGFLTAVTLYSTMVGVVYQLVLRGIWEPTSLQRIVDEMLHSIIPVYVIVFWFIYEDKRNVSWKSIPNWLLYPLFYLAFILFRGNDSGYYPYPFVNVAELGLEKVLLNSGALLIIFLVLAIVFVGLGKLFKEYKFK
jgi:hypothetical protein